MSALAAEREAVGAPPERESVGQVVRRRAISIPVVCLLWGTLVLASPLWIPLAWLADRLMSGRRASLRCFAFLVVYLTHELAGLLACLGIGLASSIEGNGVNASERRFRRYFALQKWWSNGLLRWAVRLFRMRFEAEDTEVLDRPMILMLRHTSIADTLLAGEYVSRPHDFHLRYIMKRELLVDPCLDIVGHCLPNYFVHRDSDDTARELAGVRGLLRDLRSSEGVLIYPEGTRASASKRQRIIEHFEKRGDTDRAQAARALDHVLPPRLGGAIALLQVNPGLDVVFCAHTGFEGAANPRELLKGSLLDQRIQVGFWRVAFGEIPIESDAQAAWLNEHWKKIDTWIDQRVSSR